MIEQTDMKVNTRDLSAYLKEVHGREIYGATGLSRNVEGVVWLVRSLFASIPIITDAVLNYYQSTSHGNIGTNDGLFIIETYSSANCRPI